MSKPDVINLLPDAIANQIAAGEVIQRPASVVKELVENAIDAKATHITVNIKDAGKTLIQVIDDGIGMSETDARMCFERHATSKIRDVNDLFSILTMGFRGEALASIASIAEVELKTRQENDELGTRIVIEGSEVKIQERISCPKGSNFSVKKLFFNVPARRKFLRKDTTEFGFIINEFQKVAIANPDINFELYHNGKQIYSLPKGNLARRLMSIFGEKIKKEILPVEVDLPGLLRIYGYIGKPETAKKKSPQFFFVNKRYFRHSWFHKALTETYKDLIKPDTAPMYFIFFEIDPQKIDVNIHPTKTEIKFEDEVNVQKHLVAAVRNTLYKYNIFPSIDFNRVLDDLPQHTVVPEENKSTPHTVSHHHGNTSSMPASKSHTGGASVKDIEEYMKIVYGAEEPVPDLLPDNEDNQSLIIESSLNENDVPQLPDEPGFILYRNRFIITEVSSGLLIIDARKALEAINYKKALELIEGQRIKSQYVLDPLKTGIISKNKALVEDFVKTVSRFGFEIEDIKDELYVKAYPPVLNDKEALEVARDLFYLFEDGLDMEDENLVNKKIALQLSKTSAVVTNLNNLSQEGIKSLVVSLFELPEHDRTVTGEKIMDILPHDFLENFFK